LPELKDKEQGSQHGECNAMHGSGGDGQHVTTAAQHKMMEKDKVHHGVKS
jgi:hypothetical protein